MDAAQDRLTAESRARFDAAVEAVRVGTIVAHDAKQYTRWRSEAARRSGHDTSLDLAQLARDFGGGHIVKGDFEFRN